ncbi:MAG: response regulator [Deltaproteobacteria bacterium]|nr:response regulator [Deltaproteobacteria bacterium]
MNNIVDWLIGFEENSARLYEKAAVRSMGDKALSEFLSRLADDEKTPRDYLVKASVVLKRRWPGRIITIDSAGRKQMEELRASQERLVEGGEITRTELFDCIVANEYSEWNDYFLYAVNIVKKECSELIPALVTTQRHKRFIERFIESQPDLDRHLKTLKGLSTVWEEKLLVVDDEEMIVDAVKAVLDDEGVVECASNGKEALKMIGEKFYAAVITDVDMPVLNGIEFYKEAVRLFPSIKGRFMFFTGGAGQESARFFRENNLKYLNKPSTLGEIKDAVIEILSR